MEKGMMKRRDFLKNVGASAMMAGTVSTPLVSWLCEATAFAQFAEQSFDPPAATSAIHKCCDMPYAMVPSSARTARFITTAHFIALISMRQFWVAIAPSCAF
jgi:hypothetical protein